jgi:hypothetical protein
MNETCPPGQPGQGGTQQDLNTPVVPTVPQVQTLAQTHGMVDLWSLCTSGLSPRLTTGVLMKLVANHFSNPNLIFTPNLKRYTWSPDPAATTIRLVQNTNFDPVTAGMYPAVVFTRTGVQSMGRAINDQLDQVDQRSVDLGIGSYVRFMQGGHRITCLSNAAGEAEDLALEIFDILTWLSPALRSQGMFHHFQVMSLGELGTLEDQGNLFGVPIEVQYAYEYAWELQPLAPTLKAFNFNLT